MTEQELLDLLFDIRPDLQAHQSNLTKLWPGPEVITHLHRVDSLLARIDKALKTCEHDWQDNSTIYTCTKCGEERLNI